MSAWKHVAGFKWTEFNSADKVIPFPLTLHLALMKAGANEGIKVKKVPSLMLAPIDNADNHNRFGGDRGGGWRGNEEEAPIHFQSFISAPYHFKSFVPAWTPAPSATRSMS